jgi:glutamate decarboxylase
MVHINRVATTKEVADAKDQYETTVPNPKSTINLTPDDEADDYTATVYGSRYATEDLPRHEMPEKEMPAQIAYRMIKDDLTLDGTPTLNLASFVTTYMEEEAEKLMVYVRVNSLTTTPLTTTPTATPSPRTSSTTKSTPCPPTSRTAASP